MSVVPGMMTDPLTITNTTICFNTLMAEREGFEPSVGFSLHTLSKRAP